MAGTFFRPSQPRKASAPTDFTVAAIERSVKAAQSLKAEAGMLSQSVSETVFSDCGTDSAPSVPKMKPKCAFTLSRFSPTKGSDIEVRELHPSKAEAPMLVTLFGTETPKKLLQL